jgi:hypothetical protein
MVKIRFDPTTGLSWIPAVLLMLGFLITAIGNLTNYFTFTAQQAGYISFIVFILTLLATTLTTEEENPVYDDEY